MAGKKKLDMFGDSALTSYAASTPDQDAPEKKSNVSPNSIKNLHPRTDGKSPTKYMQINVHDYEDYLYRMARYHKQTTTKYVISLIKKDMEEHLEEYESLKKLAEFDKPYRESPNRKNNKVAADDSVS